LLAVIFSVAVGCTARKATAPADAKPAPAPRAAFVPPTTEEGCRACNGNWGVHGIASGEDGLRRSEPIAGGSGNPPRVPGTIDPTPTCLCRTHDVGRRCRGKDECEGDCLGDAGEREVTQPGPPARGFWLGHCSEFHATFGCHVFLLCAD